MNKYIKILLNYQKKKNHYTNDSFIIPKLSSSN